VPSARRKAAKHLVAKKQYTVQMACRTVELNRSTYYHQPVENGFEQRLVEALYRLSRRYPRYGYEMITWKLKQAGWSVNKKRIQRLWRREGLKVLPKQHKKRRLSPSTTARQIALYPNHVWSWDFLFDRTEDGRSVKILNIVDEYSRFNITLEVKRHFKAEDVVVALGEAMVRYGIPGCIRSDNGSEFIAGRIKQWLKENGIGIMYIGPGSPWENAYVESLNGRLRDECLNRELFTHLLEAQIVVSDWREEYNYHRPHGSLRRQTPASVYEKFIAPGPLRRPGFGVSHDTQTLGEYYH
jgi:transposase InsO family protein